MPRASLHLFTLSMATLASSALAQFQPGDIVVTNYSPPGVFAIPPGGAPAAITPSVALSGPSGVDATARGEIVIADFTGDRLVLVQPTGAATVVASGLGGCLRVVEDFDGSFLVSTSNGLSRVTRQGNVSSVVASGGPIGRVFGVAIDGDGTYLIADDRNDALHRVTPQGAVTTLHSGPPFQLPQGVAVLGNGQIAVFDGLTDSVFGVDRTTSAVTTFVANAALGGNPCGIAASFDGGVLVSQSSASLNRVVAIDAGGTVTPIATGGPFQNLEDVTRVRMLTGPVALTTGPGAVYSLTLQIPTDGSLFYSTALAASLYPGFTPFAADQRRFSLAPDAYLGATIGINAPPLLTSWAGVLDPQGTATLTIDLRVLPVGVLVGQRFFAQSFTLPPASTASIVSYGNVHPLSF